MNEKKEPVTVTSPPDYKTEIVEILRSNYTPVYMRNRILDYHENDIAAAMEMLEHDERNKLYNILDPETLANILEYSGEFPVYIRELNVRKRIQVLSCLDAQTVAEHLGKMEKAERNLLIDLMEDDLKREVTMLCSYDDDEIGSKMSTNYIAINSGMSVREAMRSLVDQAADNDNISKIYVIDDAKVLVGAIELKDLIIARETTSLEDITITSYPYVYASEQIADCIDRIRGYSEDSIPVLDSENKLHGIITAQTIAQLVEDEMGDDYAMFAGLTTEEDLREPITKSLRKRLPWLIVLLGLALIVSSVVSMFESIVSHLAIIVSFQSLVLGMAGNVGTQSLAVTIRVLMDDRVNGKDKLYLIGKEARVGLCNGAVLGVLSFVVIGIYMFLIKGYDIMFAFSVSSCTGLALLLAMFLSSVAGTVIPMTFKKLNIDPAVASGPLISTLNDLVAVVSYYGLAWILLITILKF